MQISKTTEINKEHLVFKKAFLNRNDNYLQWEIYKRKKLFSHAI